MTIYGVGLVLGLLCIAWGVWMLLRTRVSVPSEWRFTGVEYKASMPQGPYRGPAKVESEPRDYPLNPLRRIEEAAEDVAQRAEAARIRFAEAEKQLRRAEVHIAARTKDLRWGPEVQQIYNRWSLVRVSTSRVLALEMEPQLDDLLEAIATRLEEMRDG